VLSHLDLTCYPSKYAKDKLVSGVASEHVNITVVELDDRYIYTSEGEEPTNGNNGDPMTRGLLILPDENIHGGSYSPYAWGMAKAGHYVVLLKSITKLTDIEVYGKTISAFETHYDVKHWGISGHGRGGYLAAKLAKIDNGKKITGVVILGSDFDVDLGDGRRVLLVTYGLDDTVVSPNVIQHSLSLHASYESTVTPLANIAHLDFSFSTCLTNSFNYGNKLYFESLSVPVFTMPNKTNRIEILNIDDKILSKDDERMSACRYYSLEHLDNDTDEWISLNTNIFYVRSHRNHLNIEIRTFYANYDNVVSVLENKKVKLTVKCGLKYESIVFYISYDADFEIDESKARTIEDTIVSNMNTMMSFLDWRNPSQRGMKFVEDYVIDNLSNDVTKPLPLRWYVWDPRNVSTNTSRGYVFLVGAAVHPNAYGSIATQLRNMGITVVIIASPSRMAMSSAALASLVPMNPMFSHIEKWAIGGHSLGASASSLGYFIAPQYFDAIIMYSGLLPATLDFSNRDVPITNIFGSLDDVNPGGYQRFIDNFGNYNANVTTFEIVEGGNHYYVGDYGDQKDSVGTISRDMQQEIYANITYAKIMDM